jgi:predicted TIM-barrel fold metal-dependent hydrolase
MALGDFQPKSMLAAEQNLVEQARFPVIDAHTHVSWVNRYAPRPGDALQGSPAERVAQIVRWMDELNLRTMLVHAAGAGDQLRRNIALTQEEHEGRFLVTAEPSWDKTADQDYSAWQAADLKRAKEGGAAGLKILKTLGLYLREDGVGSPLVKVDDPRFDPMWQTAGELGMPVFIHTSDPDAFFTPIDRFNERWEELGNHPDWSFHGADYPSKGELLAARNRVIERHPGTNFVCLHVANHSENLDEVSSWLNEYPNMYVEIGARIGELGRQPRRTRRFFEEFPDRILFGTDATPNGTDFPQQDLRPELFRIYFRFLETLDEYFDYAPSATPPQGRWKISGIGLPEEILKKVYYDNAAGLLGVDKL